MGAMAELRPIIVIGSFMAIIVILISIMPAGFFGSNGTTANPSNTNFYSLLGTNDTITFNLTGHTYDFGNKDFGGWHIDVQEQQIAYSHEPIIWVQVYDAWYGYFYNKNDFTWYDQNNVKQSVKKTIMWLSGSTYYFEDHEVMRITDINNTFINSGMSDLLYTLESTKTTIKVALLWDNTTYFNPYTAYLAGNMTMAVGIGIDERNTQINAWSVIGSFLTFQLIPNCEPTIALLVEIPFWFAELYVVFIMVLRVIGAVFGGGGA